jgi:hypothetical protein
VPSAVCDCGRTETAEHIFWECPPDNKKKRPELINILKKNGKIQTLHSLVEMLKMRNMREVKGLFEFINDIPKYM